MAMSRIIVKRHTTITHLNKDEPEAQRQLLLVSAFHVQRWKSEDTSHQDLAINLYLSVMNVATWQSIRQF